MTLRRSVRILRAGLLIVVMGGFGLGVWRLLGAFQTHFLTGVRPDQSQALVSLPGTVVLAQGGTLYRLRGESFTAITGRSGRWTQPTLVPGGGLIAVSQTIDYSNLVQLASNRRDRRLLTHNAAPVQADNHWAYYPRVSADGRSVFYAYDLHDPAASYDVTFAIMSQPLAGGTPTQWTTPNPYTGGDVQPVPLPGGGLIYSKWAIDSTGHTYSQLWLQSGPGQLGVPLTTPTSNCQEPALAPTGHLLAMICVDARTQQDTLAVAGFNGHSLGPRRTLATGPLPASPTWSPSGTQLLYLAPAGRLGPFQLWWLRTPLARRPGAPVQVTSGLDLTATSAVAWK
ncbi:MAG TPA: hypothetical protein VMW47_04545 [Verrucomicrobiae bacterium]|nr:hypothetical protein [Verrucomicrobiae bacterium]